MSPLFQRRHYDALAIALGEANDEGSWQAFEKIEDMLARDNPSFSRVEFREATWKARIALNEREAAESGE